MVRAKFDRPGIIASHRNPSRAHQNSPSIIYENDEEPKIVRLDFVFFVQQGDGAVTAPSSIRTAFSSAMPFQSEETCAICGAL